MPKYLDLLLPMDGDGNPLSIVPARAALAVTVDASVSGATDITLNAATQFIEVNALSKGVYMRYAATASASDFDEYIAADQVRHYAIPDGVTIISFIEEAASAKIVVIEK